MLLPGRTYLSTSSYRYGFNGKEQDSAFGGGNGIDYDYGERIYDARIGKFLSVDPLTTKYPELTPYQFATNRPIDGIDLDGLEWELSTVKHNLQTKFETGWAYSINLMHSTTVGLPTASHPPLNVRLHSYFSHPDPKSPSQIFLGPVYTGLSFLYNLINDTKIVGSSFVNGGDNATDLIGDRTNIKERIGSFIDVSIAAITAGEASEVDNVFFAQDSHANEFSRIGQEKLGVKTLNEAVVNLKSGAWSASKLPIDYVVRDGKIYLLNTRSVVVLKEAGVPQSEWVFQDQTGVKLYEDNLTKNLKGSSGYKKITNRVTKKITHI